MTSSAASAIYLNTRDSQLGRGEPVEKRRAGDLAHEWTW